MNESILIASTDAEISDCFDAFKALRPHLERADFVARVRRQQQQSYTILALRRDTAVVSAAGFRIGEFLAWGRILYLDDLTTLDAARGQGYAGRLLDWLVKHARAEACTALHLDSGYARQAAHRLYLRKGFELSAHHFSLPLNAGE